MVLYRSAMLSVNDKGKWLIDVPAASDDNIVIFFDEKRRINRDLKHNPPYLVAFYECIL